MLPIGTRGTIATTLEWHRDWFPYAQVARMHLGRNVAALLSDLHLGTLSAWVVATLARRNGARELYIARQAHHLHVRRGHDAPKILASMRDALSSIQFVGRRQGGELTIVGTTRDPLQSLLIGFILEPSSHDASVEIARCKTAFFVGTKEIRRQLRRGDIRPTRWGERD